MKDEIFFDICNSLDKERKLSEWEVDELYDLIDILTRHFKDKTKATDWFFRENHFLHNKAPFAMINKGRVFEVRKFARTFFLTRN